MERQASLLSLASAVLGGLLVCLLSIVLMISVAGHDLLRTAGRLPAPGDRALPVRRRGARRRRRLRHVVSRHDLPPAGRHRRHPRAERRGDRRARSPAASPATLYATVAVLIALASVVTGARLHRRRRAAARGAGAVHPLPGDGRLHGRRRLPDDRRRGPHGDRPVGARRPRPPGGGLALAAGAGARRRDDLGRAAVGQGPGAAGDGGGWPSPASTSGCCSPASTWRRPGQRGLLLGPFEVDRGFLGAFRPGLLRAGRLPRASCRRSRRWRRWSASPSSAAMLNASGIELGTGEPVDLNRDLRGVGVANLLAGLGGGVAGYHVLGGTLLANRLIGANSRWIGVGVGLTSGVALVAGASVLVGAAGRRLRGGAGLPRHRPALPVALGRAAAAGAAGLPARPRHPRHRGHRRLPPGDRRRRAGGLGAVRLRLLAARRDPRAR